MLQFACYRNYNAPLELLLETSGWFNQPKFLKDFLSNIKAEHGRENEAVEIGLQFANEEASECSLGVPLS